MGQLYNDMWRRVNGLESTVKTVISLSNATRRDVQTLSVAAMHGRGSYHPRPSDDIRSSAGEVQIPTSDTFFITKILLNRGEGPDDVNCCFFVPGNLEYALNMHDESVGRHLSSMQETLLHELKDVQSLQDTFMRSCNRLNEKEIFIDDKLTRVLGHHTDMLLKQEHALGDVQRLLKTHNTHSGRTAANATEGVKVDYTAKLAERLPNVDSSAGRLQAEHTRLSASSTGQQPCSLAVSHP